MLYLSVIHSISKNIVLFFLFFFIFKILRLLSSWKTNYSKKIQEHQTPRGASLVQVLTLHLSINENEGRLVYPFPI